LRCQPYCARGLTASSSIASDRAEPKHVHVEREDKVAKFWLEPVRLHASGGFSRAEILRLHELIRGNATKLSEAWNAYFNG
jgi:hypothetical protein